MPSNTPAARWPPPRAGLSKDAKTMHDDNRRGIALMLVAMAALIVSDTLMKVASQDLPVGQAIFIRGVVLVPVLAIAAWRTGALARMSEVFHPSVGVRTIGEMASTGLYMTALAHLPIANATAILQLVPLLSIAGAALVLGEAVGLRRSLAVLVGLAAVLLIIRPGMAGFNAWALVAVLAALFITVRDLASRRLPPNSSSLAVSLVAALGVSALSLGMTSPAAWISPTATSLGCSAMAGLVLALAYFSIVGAMRSGEVAVVAPYRYTIVLWAILIQIVVFGATPDPLTLLGAAVLVATGIYAFVSERRLRRPRALAPR